MWPFTSKWELIESDIMGVRSHYFPGISGSTYKKEKVLFDKYCSKRFNGTFEYKRVVTHVFDEKMEIYND